MELKHSVSFMIGNMGYLGKIFIWMLVCTLVVGGLAAAIYIPSGSALAKNEEDKARLGTVLYNLLPFFCAYFVCIYSTC